MFAREGEGVCIINKFKGGIRGYDVNDVSHEDDMHGGVSENLKDVEGENDREKIPKTNFEVVPDKRIFEGNSVRQNDVHSEDPFGIYKVLNKKRDGKNIDDQHEDSLKYPPRFIPNEEGDVPIEKVDNWSDENRVNDGQEDGVYVGQHVHERVEVSNDTHESTCSGHFKKSEVPRKGGSILEQINDFVNVGQTMGYDMTGFVFMGDFNEVRDISERFGSIFNKHGTEAFNSFIVNAGLMEVSLGGCSFMWCHKSAKKMGKLDRFLISDNLMCSCPGISSTSLDRFLLDHRPIIMREAHYDYGPIPFKFFHYWFKLDGFDKLVEQTWLEANGSDVDGHRRREVVRLIQEVEKVDAMKVAQKAKIKWSIEGDENSKYYHGVLNKKRDRLTIRGVLVDGSREGDLMSRIQSWHDVTEGMHTRLSKWKLKTLSIGGRLTLLKYVLGAIPIYHMSIFKVPMKVLQNMESIRARFFNGADVNSMKLSWVRWKSVLAAKDVGGLGCPTYSR
nr:RNA-directed DNA polymerase, eukaryota [Tanacetum cinerariifolium]